MVDSSIYAAFERMWQHVLTKFNNYVPTEVIDNHIENKDNPHAVTAEQVGAYTIDEVDAKVASLEVVADTDDGGILLFNTNMSTDASGNVGSAHAVLYTTQTLTEKQKAQARENIGAATLEEILAAIPIAEGVMY